MHVLRMLRGLGVTPGVCYAPDAGAGAAVSQPAAGGHDAAGGDPSSASDADGGAGDDPGTGMSADDDLDDDALLYGPDDEDGPQSRPLEEQLKALRRANQRLRKRYGKVKPLADRLNGVNLDDLVTRARQYDALEASARQNPRLRALLYGDAPDPTGTRASASRPTLPRLPDRFDADTLGFDPDGSPANKVIAAAIQHVAHLAQQVERLQRLAPTVETLDRTVRARSEAEERREWETTLQSATDQLRKVLPGDDWTLQIVRDAFVGAYETRRQHGKRPQEILAHYLKGLERKGQLSKRQATQISAGTQARMAQHNQTLPRSPAGGGTPSPAAGNARPTLKDVHKRFRSGQIGPAARA